MQPANITIKYPDKKFHILTLFSIFRLMQHDEDVAGVSVYADELYSHYSIFHGHTAAAKQLSNMLLGRLIRILYPHVTTTNKDKLLSYHGIRLKQIVDEPLCTLPELAEILLDDMQRLAKPTENTLIFLHNTVIEVRETV